MLTRSRVAVTLANTGVVPVFSVGDLEVAKRVLEALVVAGIPVLEFTLRFPGSSDVALKLIEWARGEYPGVVVGVGSVVDTTTASIFVEEGAAFVFAPTFSSDVAKVCHRRGVLYVPGCATVSEIQTAYESGCGMVKLFPAGAVGGPAYLSAIRQACPWLQVIPTGGVEPTVASLTEWYGAGAPAVGIGSKLFDQDVIRSDEWETLQASLVAVAQMVQQVRSSVD